NFVAQHAQDFRQPALRSLEHSIVVKRTPAAEIDQWHVDVKSRRLEHFHRSYRSLRMKKVIKCVGPKNDARFAGVSDWALPESSFEILAREPWQFSFSR